MLENKSTYYATLSEKTDNTNLKVINKQYQMRNMNKPISDKTPPPTPPEEENHKFECLYLLVEAAVAVQKQEKEQNQLVAEMNILNGKC